MAYADEGVPLVVLAGKEYGSGSSRDWAAKGTALLGVRAVIAESFERIHRSNLIGMGVLPLQFPDGETVESLGLTGEETFDVGDLENGEAKTVDGDREPRRRRRDRASRPASASTPRTRSSTSATAASSTASCATCARRQPQAEAPKCAGLQAPQKRSWRGGAAGGRGSTRPAPRLRVGSQGGMPTRSSPEAGLAGDELLEERSPSPC